MCLKLEKKKISEIFFLRSIACLSVVMVHSIGRYIQINEEISAWNALYTLMTYGTPTFIFISILLLSYSYRDNLPSGFLVKRFKYILIPYISMAIIYAALNNISSLSGVIKWSIFNIAGGYHGYFVLVIFQLYILYYLFGKYLSKSSPSLIITISLIVNVIYLAAFNLTTPPSENFLITYLWDRGYWSPFIGWIFYFSLAYYCGRFYSDFIELLVKYQKSLIVVTIITGLVVVFTLNIFPESSKTIPMLFFSISAMFTIYRLGLKLKTVPSLLVLISQYSFGIYLTHILYLNLFLALFSRTGVDLGYWVIPIYFIGGISLSIVTVYTVNKFRFGKYIVGKIGIKPKSKDIVSLKGYQEIEQNG